MLEEKIELIKDYLSKRGYIFKRFESNYTGAKHSFSENIWDFYVDKNDVSYRVSVVNIQSEYRFSFVYQKEIDGEWYEYWNRLDGPAFVNLDNAYTPDFFIDDEQIKFQDYWLRKDTTLLEADNIYDWYLEAKAIKSGYINLL
jgi:hypothetical protein